MKKQSTSLTKTEKIKTLDALYTAVSALRGRDTVKLFLRDLLTESERIMLGRRILIAQLLIKKETHENIVQRLGVGMDTIQRVQYWLNDQFPGYEIAVRALQKELEKRRQPFSFAMLKKKYPQHFILFTIVDELKKKT